MDAAEKAGRNLRSLAAGPRRALVIAVLAGQSKRLNASSSRAAFPPSGRAGNRYGQADVADGFLD